MSSNRRPTRRHVLNGALAAVGLAGSAAAARFGLGHDATGNSSSEDGREEATTVQTVLFLDRYTLHSSGGAVRQKGDQSLLRGTLITAEGERAGELFASAVTMPGPVDEEWPRTPRMEFQTLQLSKGTLVAMGTVFAQSDIPNVYTIVGGNGAYARARGTYRFDENPNVARPEGRATITLDLLT